ncbi:MAG: flagellar export chaperone FliS [Chloroherpetonaceae bacterium]|nr:flagellar export chaperone FliS [Chthonomonadaceae bacterium]MDW8207009.1 flagellar export chaperone FliS [Chloroherpetonaceae bacterium]
MSLASSLSDENARSDIVLPRPEPVPPSSDAGGPRSRPGRLAPRQYQQVQIETASPTRLIVMLYDGALRFCTLALEAMQARQLEAQNNYLIKAQRIIGELMSSLNREAGGEVAANLFRLYTHILQQLVQANLTDDPALIESAIQALRELRESWAQVDLMMAQSGAGQPRPQESTGDQRA